MRSQGNGFLARVGAAALWGRPYVRLTLEHAENCLAVSGVPILIVIAPIGAVIALQGLLVFSQIGAREMIGSMLVGSMLLEVAPAFVALLLATQVGSAYAAELGSMAIGQETDYHEAIAVDPYARLVLPRILALVIAAPLLAALAAAAGAAIGLSIAATWGQTSPAMMLQNIRQLVAPGDCFVCLAKAMAFGAVVGATSCAIGMRVKGGSAEVGRAANRAIVGSILGCVVLNYLLASFFMQSGVLQ